MDITTEVLSAFREDKKGFSDSTVWSDREIKRALQKADRETGSSRWGVYKDLSFKQEGLFSYAAHYLIMSAREAKLTKNNGVAPTVAPIASKSVGDESVSYSVAGGATLRNTGEVWLSATAYGQEFIRLRRRAAAGGVCV